jgi:4-amino-4-deoxy-L-arabinose transferase-like glycosyltransferase
MRAGFPSLKSGAHSTYTHPASSAVPRHAALKWLLRPYLLYASAYTILTAELLFMVFYRSVNLDEGWYLWASKLVYSGKLLYRDFTYTQSPLLPYVYGAVLQVIGEGLYQGRFLTIFFAMLTGLLIVRMATRQAGAWAGLSSLLLFSSSVYMLAYFSYTATYALTAFLLVTALYFSQLQPDRSRDRLALVAAATLFFCLAVATRLSVVAAAPFFFGYLLWRSPDRRQSALVVAGTGVVVLGGIFLPFWLAGARLFVYDTFGFHVDRILRWEWHAEKIVRVTLQTVRDLWALCLLNLVGLAYWLWRIRRDGNRRARLRQHAFALAIAGIFVSIFLVQLIPSTTISHYNTLQAPLLALTGGIILARWWRTIQARQPGAGRLAPLLAVAALLLLHGAQQMQVVRAYDLISLPPVNQVTVVQAAARFLQQHTPPQATLLTFNTHLALEANRPIPPGYEMSIFAYRPTWDTNTARDFRAINNEILVEHLEQGVEAVALTDFDLERLYGEREEVLSALHSAYRLRHTLPGFDPFRRNLYIYLPAQFELPPDLQPRAVQFDNQIRLLGHDLSPATAPRGQFLRFGLYWQVDSVPERGYTVFTHLVDAGGVQVAGWDNPPCRNTCPTPSWQPGEVVYDEYLLPVATLLPGEYHLMVGMYETESGAPVHALAPTPEQDKSRILLTSLRLE